MKALLIKENEMEGRLEILTFLTKNGFGKNKDELRTQDEIVNESLPIVVNMSDRSFSMMGNITCAAAAVSSAVMITKEEFYRVFKKKGYNEPSNYLKPEAIEAFEESVEKRKASDESSIDDFEDRMTSPITAIRIDPETGEPI